MLVRGWSRLEGKITGGEPSPSTMRRVISVCSQAIRSVLEAERIVFKKVVRFLPKVS